MSEDLIINNLEIIQEDLRKIEKQYIINPDQDKLLRNVHKLIEKSDKLDLKNIVTRPKIFEIIKNNSKQEKRTKELFIEHHGNNKFKIKSSKKK